jgi:hypothetical protein
MNRLGMQKRIRAVGDVVFPSLRVIGMAYTGLIGVAAVALVVSVALLPVTPVLQQAAQPAYVAMGSLVQPATEAVASIIGNRPDRRDPAFPFTSAPPVALARAVPPEEVVPADAPDTENDQTEAVEAPAPVRSTRVAVASARPPRAVQVEEPDAVVEDEPAEEPEQAVEARNRAPVPEPIAVLADGPVQQAADAEPARPLPPVPTPTETALQTRARLDVENQAAIDAAKALLVRLKAEANVANQAAIDIRKGIAPAATVVATLTPPKTSPPVVAKKVVPTPVPTAPPATPVTVAPIPVSTKEPVHSRAAATVDSSDENEMPNTYALDASSP